MSSLNEHFPIARGLGRVLIVLMPLAFMACGEPIPVAPADEPLVAAAAEPARGTAGGAAPTLRDRPCEALTPRIVSEIMGVPARELQGMNVAGTCTYAWADGEGWQRGSAALTDFRIFVEQDDAERYFEQTYRSMTPEEVEEMEARIRAERQQALQTGQVTEAELAQAAGVDAAVAAMDLEEITGVGDQARYDGTVRFAEIAGAGPVRIPESTLYVRSGTVVLGVRADRFTPATLQEARLGPTEAQRQTNRDLTFRLAQRILATIQ